MKNARKRSNQSSKSSKSSHIMRNALVVLILNLFLLQAMVSGCARRPVMNSPGMTRTSTETAPGDTANATAGTPARSATAAATEASAAAATTESANPARGIPDGFVYLDEVIPDVRYDIRYSTANNFTGKIVTGYLVNRVILTEAVALALKAADNEFRQSGYRIKIFDAYRPLGAGEAFTQWALDISDNKTKSEYYPDVEKKDMFSLGFIAYGRSSHSRGSTVDMTITYANTGTEVDMGTPFDFFGFATRHGSTLVNDQQSANRQYFRQVMEKHGFTPYLGEWWEYRLVNEPFPEVYFDFPVQ